MWLILSFSLVTFYFFLPQIKRIRKDFFSFFFSLADLADLADLNLFNHFICCYLFTEIWKNKSA